MGLDYSFVIGFERHKVDDMINVVFDSVTDECKSSLLRAMPWEPDKELSGALLESGKIDYVAYGFKNLNVCNSQTSNYYCLTISIPLTKELHSDLLTHGYDDCANNNTANIGCVYWSLFVGRKYGIFELCAATSTMSRLFHQSNSIKNFIIKKFQGLSLFILMDVEQSTDILLYPESKFIVPTDYEYYTIEDGFILSPDSYVECFKNNRQAREK